MTNKTKFPKTMSRAMFEAYQLLDYDITSSCRFITMPEDGDDDFKYILSRSDAEDAAFETNINRDPDDESETTAEHIIDAFLRHESAVNEFNVRFNTNLRLVVTDQFSELSNSKNCLNFT